MVMRYYFRGYRIDFVEDIGAQGGIIGTEFEYVEGARFPHFMPDFNQSMSYDLTKYGPYGDGSEEVALFADAIHCRRIVAKFWVIESILHEFTERYCVGRTYF